MCSPLFTAAQRTAYIMLARVFFDVRSSDGTVVPDEHGKALLDLDTALNEAQLCAHKRAVAELRRTGIVDGRKVEILGETGKLLDKVRVRDAIILPDPAI